MSANDGKLKAYLAHRAALVRYATPLLGSRSQAEDVVQEAYLRIAAPESAAGPAKLPLSYLYRVVRNLAFDWLRRRGVEKRQEEAEPPDWMLPAALPSPERQLQQREELALVATVLAELPEQARIAVEMHRFGGHTLQEIAARLSVSVPTAHRLIRDAIARIAERLEAASRTKA